MRRAPGPIVVASRPRDATLVHPHLLLAVGLEPRVTRLVVEHRRETGPTAAVDPDVRVRRAHDLRFEIHRRRADGRIVGPRVPAARILDQRRDVRPAARDRECAAGAAAGHHQRTRGPRLRGRTRAERLVARLQAAVNRSCALLFVQEEGEIFQPLGTAERGRFEPFGVRDDRNASRTNHRECGTRRAAAHQQRRTIRHNQFSVDDGDGSELADVPGGGTCDELVPDQLAETRHTGEDIESAQIDQQRQVRGR